jgi:LytS/YehU family sensor histidine kinase
VQNVEVPTLLLQPLVENAIKHGVGGRIGAGEITVRAWRERDLLHVSVADDGPGPATSVPNASPGIGLANTRARLSVLFGQAATLKLERRAQGGAEVVVTIPIREAANRNRDGTSSPRRRRGRRAARARRLAADLSPRASTSSRRAPMAAPPWT